MYLGSAKISVPYTKVHKIVDGMCLLAILGMFLYAWSMFAELPHLVPTHFNFAGHPDAFGEKNTIFFLPGVALFVSVMIVITRFNPRFLNVPIKVTEENANRVFAIAVNMLTGLQVIITLLFGFLLYQSTNIAKVKGSTLMMFPFYVFQAALLLLVVISIVKMYRVAKPKA